MATTTAPPSSRGGPSGLSGWVDRHFKIGQRGSTVRTELVAGLATWLTMSYILFVNPGILGQVNLLARTSVNATKAFSPRPAASAKGYFA